MMVYRVTDGNLDGTVVEVEVNGQTFTSTTADWTWWDEWSGEAVTHPAQKYHLHQAAGRITPRFKKN